MLQTSDSGNIGDADLHWNKSAEDSGLRSRGSIRVSENLPQCSLHRLLHTLTAIKVERSNRSLRKKQRWTSLCALKRVDWELWVLAHSSALRQLTRPKAFWNDFQVPQLWSLEALEEENRGSAKVDAMRQKRSLNIKRFFHSDGTLVRESFLASWQLL